MKYMWSNQNANGLINMAPSHKEFIIRPDHCLKMDNLKKSSPKVKRFRSAFTTDQVNYLEQQFKKFPYIGNAQRKEVALALNIPERAVKIWFQNRRMKEKKETTSKEFEDESSNQKSMEFAKDQFNNVTISSANDQMSYSLPLAVDVSKVNCDKNILNNNLSGSLSSGHLVQDLGFKAMEDTIRVNKNYVFPADFIVKPIRPISPNSYVKSAEFSIDLCKKYKSNVFTAPNILKPDSGKEQDIKHKPMSCKGEQMSPEDLSSNRKYTVPTTSQQPNILPNNPGYVSMVPTVAPFYAQPYGANGIVWKPVNVMPNVTPPGHSMAVPNLGIIPTVQETQPKKCCSCDCHEKQLMPYNFQQEPLNPQYIFTAVQFPSSSDTKY